jgi:hypothetical protein
MERAMNAIVGGTRYYNATILLRDGHIGMKVTGQLALGSFDNHTVPVYLDINTRWYLNR